MRAPKYFIDTNVFIRFFVTDNRNMSEDCIAFIEGVRDGHISAGTSSLVLAEIQWVLGGFYAFGKTDVVAALGSVAPFVSPAFYAPQPLMAVALYEAHAVKFIDTLIASHPDIARGAVTVVSYDKDFDKLGVTRVEPRAALRRA